MKLSLPIAGAAAVLVSGLTVSSCNVTDLTPASSLTGTQFYRTGDDANAAIISVYSRLIQDDVTQRVFYWGEARADQTSPGVWWGQDGDVQIAKRQQQNQTQQLVNWAPMYAAIQRANDALKNLPNVPTSASFSDTRKKQLIGEAATLRAFCYLNLLRTYGEVPIVTEPSDRADKDYLVAKSPEKDVIAQIEKDCALAIANMPVSEQSAAGRRRASRGAAKAILAHARMWNNDYQGALTVLDDLIANEGYTLQPTSSYMLQFWTEGGTNEIIFSLGFSTNQTNGIARKNNSSTGFGIIPAGAWTAKMIARGEPVRGQWRTFIDLGLGDGAGLIIKIIGNPAADLTKPGWDGTYQSDPNVIPRDLPLLRLADMYLLRAEAKNRLNDRAGALADLNVIRKRANMPEITATAASTLNALEDAILDERDIELCFEGQRWWDIVRIGRHGRPEVVYTQATNLLGGDTKTTAVAFLRDKAQQGSWYYPLPQSEILNNKNLTQNNAYK